MPNEATSSPTGASPEPVIYTIPEKFYGLALKAKVANPASQAPIVSNPVRPRARHAWAFPALILLVLLLGVGGVFAYVERGLWWPSSKPSPAPEPPPPPPLPAPPLAPTNLTASSTAPNAVQLSWINASADEAGFRVERRDTLNGFTPITSLGPRSVTFMDVSAQASSTYTYRIIALNVGGESPTSNEATVTTPPLPPPVPEQPTLPPAGLDSDSDGLTDLEEPLYNTNPRNPDTDADSFLDGNEVYHLYNPSGKAPVRVLESGIVKPVESVVGWRLFVPQAWQLTMSADGMKGTITTGHGEVFTVTVEDHATQQSVLEWYLATHPGILSSQITSVTTKGGYEGIEGPEELARFIPWGSKIFVLRYDLHGQPFVNFRTTYEMILNSLALTAAPNLPATVTPTGSSVVASSTHMETASGTAAAAFAPVVPEPVSPSSEPTSTTHGESASLPAAETPASSP
jgi:hypothetical protein